LLQLGLQQAESEERTLDNWIGSVLLNQPAPHACLAHVARQQSLSLREAATKLAVAGFFTQPAEHLNVSHVGKQQPPALTLDTR